MKKWISAWMALAACLILAACAPGGNAGLEGSWHEENQDGTDRGTYQITFNGDGTFEERVVSQKSEGNATIVSGKYTVDGSSVTLVVTGYSSGGTEMETLMELGGENSVTRQYEIDGDTLYLYDKEKQEGRTEKSFEGKFVSGPITQ